MTEEPLEWRAKESDAEDFDDYGVPRVLNEVDTQGGAAQQPPGQQQQPPEQQQQQPFARSGRRRRRRAAPNSDSRSTLLHRAGDYLPDPPPNRTIVMFALLALALAFFRHPQVCALLAIGAVASPLLILRSFAMSLAEIWLPAACALLAVIFHSSMSIGTSRADKRRQGKALWIIVSLLLQRVADIMSAPPLMLPELGLDSQQSLGGQAVAVYGGDRLHARGVGLPLCRTEQRPTLREQEMQQTQPVSTDMDAGPGQNAIILPHPNCAFEAWSWTAGFEEYPIAFQHVEPAALEEMMLLAGTIVWSNQHECGVFKASPEVFRDMEELNADVAMHGTCDIADAHVLAPDVYLTPPGAAVASAPPVTRQQASEDPTIALQEPLQLLVDSLGRVLQLPSGMRPSGRHRRRRASPPVSPGDAVEAGTRNSNSSSAPSYTVMLATPLPVPRGVASGSDTGPHRESGHADDPAAQQDASEDATERPDLTMAGPLQETDDISYHTLEALHVRLRSQDRRRQGPPRRRMFTPIRESRAAVLEDVERLQHFGFDEDSCRTALGMFDGDVKLAATHLFRVQRSRTPRASSTPPMHNQHRGQPDIVPGQADTRRALAGQFAAAAHQTTAVAAGSWFTRPVALPSGSGRSSIMVPLCLAAAAMSRAQSEDVFRARGRGVVEWSSCVRSLRESRSHTPLELSNVMSALLRQAAAENRPIDERDRCAFAKIPWSERSRPYTFEAIVRAVACEDGYIPPLTQETLLIVFGDGAVPNLIPELEAALSAPIAPVAGAVQQDTSSHVSWTQLSAVTPAGVTPVGVAAGAPSVSTPPCARSRQLNSRLVMSQLTQLTADERFCSFWRQRQQWVDDAVEVLYVLHRQYQNTDPFRCAAAFVDLPVSWLVQPEHFGLTNDDLLSYELRRMDFAAAATRHSSGGIEAAYGVRLDSLAMCPCFVAVVVSFMERTATPPEMLFAFMSTFTGWICNKELHATLDPDRLDRRTRPRAPTQVIGDSNIGKSPFFDEFFAPFVSKVQALPWLFAGGGPKGVHLAKATAAEFGERMQAADGYSLWATPENILGLDCPYAQGRVPEKNERKVDMHELLETQNGLAFGPTSTKSAKEQVHVLRTNVGIFHFGQPRAIHDFWGQNFEMKSNIRGLGFENRPWFLWCERQDETDSSTPSVSNRPVSIFCSCLFLVQAACVGHHQSSVDFTATQIRATRGAAAFDSAVAWKLFHLRAEAAKFAVHPAAEQAAGKHGFTCGTHVINCNLQTSALLELKRCKHQMKAIYDTGEPLHEVRAQPLAPHWFDFREESALTAPSHFTMMVNSVATIFKEMCLHPRDRAGPPIAQVQKPLQRVAGEQAAVTVIERQPLSADEKLIVKLCDTYRNHAVIKVSQASGCKLSLRGNQAEVCRIFDMAASMGLGTREGEPCANVGPGGARNAQNALVFRLSLDTMPPATRDHLWPAGHVQAPRPPRRRYVSRGSRRSRRRGVRSSFSRRRAVQIPSIETSERFAELAVRFKFYGRDGCASRKAPERFRVACPFLPEQSVDAAWAASQQFFLSGFLHYGAVMRDNRVLFDALCCAPLRPPVEPGDGVSDGLKAELDEFWSSFAEVPCRYVGFIYSKLQPCADAEIIFRGLTFQTSLARAGFLESLEARGFSEPASFSTEFTAAMKFTEASVLPSAGVALALNKRGHPIRTGSSRLLCVLDGFRPIRLDGIRFGDHEQEVWVRDDAVFVKFVSGDASAIETAFRAPLPVSQGQLSRRVVANIVRQAVASDFQVAILCPLDARTSTQHRLFPESVLEGNKCKSALSSGSESLAHYSGHSRAQGARTVSSSPLLQQQRQQPQAERDHTTVNRPHAAADVLCEDCFLSPGEGAKVQAQVAAESSLRRTSKRSRHQAVQPSLGKGAAAEQVEPLEVQNNIEAGSEPCFANPSGANPGRDDQPSSQLAAKGSTATQRSARQLRRGGPVQESGRSTEASTTRADADVPPLLRHYLKSGAEVTHVFDRVAALPSSEDALHKLEQVAKDCSKSKEPFPMHVRAQKTKTKLGKHSLCRVECFTACKRQPVCPCTLTAVYDQAGQRVFVLINGRHRACDAPAPSEVECAAVRRAYTRRQPGTQEEWGTGELCCDQTIKEAEGDIYKELFRRVRLWAANPKKNGHDKAFDVWSSERERVHSEQLRIESVCKSCPKGLCSFFARTTFSSETSQFHIQYCGKHHDGPQKMPGRRIMNADQECKYYASDASPGVARLTAFVDLPYAPPSPRQLQRRAKRDKHKAMPADEQPCGLWPTESVKHAFREAGVRAPTDDDFTGDDELEMYMLGTETFQDTGGNDHVAFVVSSLACLKSVSKLANKQYIKLCADGTFKQLFGNWCTIPLGFLTKHKGRTTPRGHTLTVLSWPTTFTPLVWVVASGETGGAYCAGARVLNRLAGRPLIAGGQGIDMRQNVKQFHADMTKTAEAAREELYDKSVRCSDYWHIFEAIKTDLVTREKGRKDTILNWIVMTRTHCIKLTTVHNTWALVFNWLDKVGEHKAKDTLKKYFLLLPVEVAETEPYSASEMTMLEGGKVLCPLFWAGWDRVQPGSASGSQALESYNRLYGKLFQTPSGRRLRKATPDQIPEALRKVVKVAGQQAKKKVIFNDRPTDIDESNLRSAHLAKEGRSTAVELRTQQALIHKVTLTDLGEVAVMPRTLYKSVFIPGGDDSGPHYEWVRASDETYRISRKEARTIAKLAFQKNGKKLFREWRREGICIGDRTRNSIGLSHEQWARYHYDFVVLAWGDAADAFWKQTGRDGPNCLCNCLPFALWGGCEHEACLRDLKQKGFSLATCGQKERAQKKKKSQSLRGLSARGRAMLKKASLRRVAGKRAVCASQPKRALTRKLAGKKKATGVSQSSTWVMEIENLDLKNDAAATVAGLPQRGSAPNSRKADALQQLLQRAGAAEWYGPLLRVGCSADALATGAISAKDLCMLTTPQMPLDKAAFILKAAMDATYHAPGASGGGDQRAKQMNSVHTCAQSRRRDVCNRSRVASVGMVTS